MFVKVLSLAALAYLLGSLPFGLWISAGKGINLREIGSGNIGATNVFRALGPAWGIVVFLLDALKAWIPTIVAMHVLVNPLWHVAIGGIAVLGHSFTIFARFKGGKGVAAGLGMIMALSPIIFAIALAYGIAVIMITRMVSFASITGSILVPGLFILMGYPWPYIALVAILGGVIVVRHRHNISRILNGTENKIEWGRKGG